jgi:hypothetical protein
MHGKRHVGELRLTDARMQAHYCNKIHAWRIGGIRSRWMGFEAQGSVKLKTTYGNQQGVVW